MLFKKSYGELVQKALSDLRFNTNITNSNVGGITRSLVEVINKNISDYYEILDINMAMAFLSSAEGYYIDLIATLFNMQRIPASQASATTSDGTQKFYVSSGVLMDKIPTGEIPAGTTVSSQDGVISFYTPSTITFSGSATEVYVPITANDLGSKSNVPPNVLTLTNLGIANVFTTNEKTIVSGTDIESDSNFRFRVMNATLSAEKANETSIRMAALSVDGVADVIMRPYTRGIGTYDIIVIPLEGIATDSLVSSVQQAIDSVQAYGLKGTAIKPSIVPVDIEVKLVFTSDATDFQKSSIISQVETSIIRYIVNIPIGNSFILNELRQQIMDVSPKIKDHVINCYLFREEPVFVGNVDIYWDEMFYPNSNSANAINVI